MAMSIREISRVDSQIYRCQRHLLAFEANSNYYLEDERNKICLERWQAISAIAISIFILVITGAAVAVGGYIVMPHLIMLNPLAILFSSFGVMGLTPGATWGVYELVLGLRTLIWPADSAEERAIARREQDRHQLEGLLERKKVLAVKEREEPAG